MKLGQGAALHVRARDQHYYAGRLHGRLSPEVRSPDGSDQRRHLQRLHLRCEGERIWNLAKWLGEGHDAGTGPYTVESWHPGQEMELTLKAVPGYWGGWTGVHYKTVVFRVVREDTTAAQLIRSGQVSYVEQISPQLYQSMKNVPGLHTYSHSSWANLILYFNTKTGPLSNLKVREAVASAINYNGILAALPGVGVRTPGIIPNGLDWILRQRAHVDLQSGQGQAALGSSRLLDGTPGAATPNDVHTG